MAERPILVKATHAYAPVNNDEVKNLTFKI